MTVTDEPAVAPELLTEEAAEIIDHLVEQAFIRLMLVDDLRAATCNISCLCSALALRMAGLLREVAQLKRDAAREFIGRSE